MDIEKARSLSVIILAGGRSCRMGQDKALLKLSNGRPLLYHTAHIAQQLSSEVIVITPWPERYSAAVPPAVRLIKEPSSQNSREPDFYKLGGPLGGFLQGWAQIHADWCLLLACDLPYLERAALQQWWNWLQAQRLAPVASLTTGVKGWEPLCGYYHRSCLPPLQDYLASGQRSFQPWLATLPIAPYHDLPQSLLFNCNTPADWATVTQKPQ
jgi:molybdopterin-guanine dinucleotide biosynthesis protein A